MPSTPVPCEASERFPLGASFTHGGECQFLLWAPRAKHVELHVLDLKERICPLQEMQRGYFALSLGQATPGLRYKYRLDGEREFPDPASRRQPEGVHGPSELVDLHAFPWTDAGWQGHSLEKTVFYELHIGTFTPEGTFAALVSRLDALARLGVTTLELMPVAQFPGSRNWGYDGVYPFAPQNTYGSPRDLQTLVNAAHERGLSVALDVVYNHLGPEGNYFAQFGPYFTDQYRTPWGQAMNYDDAQSDAVRRLVIENAVYWVENFHFDALRLDAIHGIYDFSATHLLAELQQQISAVAARLGRHIHLIAESDLNDSRVIRPFAQGGYALNSQWSDDFHHSLHTLLTPERGGYYRDFGTTAHLASCLRQGWSYDGQYSEYRQHRHGNSPQGLPSSKFVVFSQNHDQTGNRARGERLSTLTDFEGLKLAAAITLLSRSVPLLFMGEEYGETAPFHYFINHSNPELIEAVRRGRASDFASFAWSGELPDPQSETTFSASKLRPQLARQEPHRTLYRFYRELLRFRKSRRLGNPARRAGHPAVQVFETERVVTEMRATPTRHLALAYCFAEREHTFSWQLPVGSWRVAVDSADRRWRGPRVTPLSAVFESSGAIGFDLHPRSALVLEQTRRPAGSKAVPA